MKPLYAILGIIISLTTLNGCMDSSDRKAAEQGDAKAQDNLGVMYANGKGVVQDDKEAFTWFRKAAEQGHAKAQDNLGVMYANGKGVVQDDKEAFTWYKKAAEQGDAKAQYNLGGKYYSGKGVVQDDKEAVKWFRKAAEQGYVSAQYNLGAMYYNGKGVIQDYKEAFTWIRKAAEQGDASAQYNLGAMYANGKGVVQDDKEAFTWFRKAAEQGYADAQNSMDAYNKRNYTEDSMGSVFNVAEFLKEPGIMALGAYYLILIFILLFFIPSILAFKRNHPQKKAILIVNVVGGLFFIGWIIALVWVFIKPTRKYTLEINPVNTSSEIEELYQLKEKGILSKEEFDLKKKDLLR